MTDAADPGAVPLNNVRWEAFAQSYARSANATQSAKDAGYKESSAYSHGQRLTKNVEIQQRIAAIKAERFKSLHMGADELLAELAKQVRFNMDSIVHITPAGEPYIDLSKASPDDMAALTEVTIEDFTDGREVDEEGNTIKRDVRRVKVKAPNKIAAATLLMKNLGLLQEKLEVTVSGQFAEVMARAERRARLARERSDDDTTGD